MIQDDDNTVLRTAPVDIFLNIARDRLKNCFTTLSSNNDDDYPSTSQGIRIQYAETPADKAIWAKYYAIGLYSNVDELIETVRGHIMRFVVNNDSVGSIDSRKFTITIF